MTTRPASFDALITRKVTFCAAHRLWDKHRSDDYNAMVYGKCVNIHGHNFVLEATFYEVIPGPDEGFKTNISLIGDLLQEAIHDRYDHQYLNDLIEFEGVNPTCENILNEFRERIPQFYKQYGLDDLRLHSLVLHETAKNTFMVKC